MIIFLYGANSYLSRQKLNKITERHRKIDKSGFNSAIFDGENLELQELKNAAESVSLLGNKKLIIVKNLISKGKDFAIKEIAGYAPQMSKSENAIIIFYESAEFKKTSALFKKLKKTAQCQEFKLLKPFELNKWVKEKFAENNSSIGKNAMEKLAAYVGPDLWQMANEIDKLVLYKTENNNQQAIITSDDIDLLVKAKIDINIFNAIETLGRKDRKRAIKNLREYIEQGVSEIYILTMFVWQFRNLILVKSLLGSEQKFSLPTAAEISKKTGLHPFVAQKTLAQAKNFTFPQLKKIYQRLLKADLDIKTGKIDSKTVLDMLAIELTK
jgi:DNA polymerase-3 subunit delta